MADEYDEYQFSELDADNPDLSETEPTEEQKPYKEESLFSNKNKVLRNGLIAVGGLILLLLIYKVLSSIFSTSDSSVKSVEAPTGTNAPVAEYQPQVESIQPPAPSLMPPSPTISDSAEPSKNTQLEAKISSMTANQQTMQAQVSAMNNQLTGVNNNLNTMMQKITELNQTIDKLNAQVDMQYRVIEQITVRMQPKKPRPLPQPTNLEPPVKYYLQAVIPGRAWLIATNGTTLTVREGTIVQGYGVVKLIDPTQGRILTSSGKEIRFSQDDS